MLSNAYFLAKFRFDTAENEPAKNLQNFAKFCKILQNLIILLTLTDRVEAYAVCPASRATGRPGISVRNSEEHAVREAEASLTFWFSFSSFFFSPSRGNLAV